ncbi:MAG: hypothetical protein HY741_17085 [Chloroflexi bacterium]|nr:hypothetical protein [Chloroflexota bacterium]
MDLSTRTVQSKPILVEILAYAPTQFFHCQHCEFVWQQVGAGAALHQEQLDSSIPDDLKREYANLSAWVRGTVDLYGGRVVFKIIDVASLEGLLKSVRYRARRYPAFIIEGKERYTGTDYEQVKSLIDNELT